MSGGRIAKHIVQTYPGELEAALLALCGARDVEDHHRVVLSPEFTLLIHWVLYGDQKRRPSLSVINQYGPLPRESKRVLLATQSPKVPFSVEPANAAVTGFIGRKLKWKVTRTTQVTSSQNFVSHSTFRAPEGAHCLRCPQVLSCKTAGGV